MQSFLSLGSVDGEHGQVKRLPETMLVSEVSEQGGESKLVEGLQDLQESMWGELSNRW